MYADQIWTCLPGVLTSYDGKKGNVRPLVQMRFTDGSQHPFPEIQEVPVITPCTAFSGIKLPVKVGDKVVLHIADRDIQKLLFKTSTAGLSITEPAICSTQRKHNITDAVAYTGFASHDSAIASDEDVYIFNNSDSDSLNYMRIKGNGDIEITTKTCKLLLEKDGNITLQNENSTLEMSEDGEIDLSNPSASINMSVDGDVEISNPLSSLLLSALGVLTVNAPLGAIFNTPLLNCTGEVAAQNNAIRLSTHTHAGVISGPASTAPPNNPS